MLSIITGDIINSKRTVPGSWLKTLKKELRQWGPTPKQWEIYRGDSFQLEVKDPADALGVAVGIKAAIKSQKGTDVRLAIGIGNKTYNAKTISESNGSAFVNSGDLLEELKRIKLNMAVRSDKVVFDLEMNLYIKLALIAMNTWTRNSAMTVHAALRYPDKSQKALGKLLGIKQNAVSTRLKRACYDEIIEVIKMYRKKDADII